MSYCRFFVWLLITGWLTLWRRHSRVGPALPMHHPDVVLPAAPPVCTGSAHGPERCALLHATGAPSARAGQLTDGYSPARLVRLLDNKVGLLESVGPHTVSHPHKGCNTHFMVSTSDYHIAYRCPDKSDSGENLDDRTARRAATLAEATPTERCCGQPVPMTRPTPRAQSFSALRMARAAAGMPTERAAAVCGLTDQALRKHLRNLPARGRCAATVAAVAASQKAPEPPSSAAVRHRACPPPAVRAARLTCLEAVAAARGSASWALGHLPHRDGSMELHAFSYTERLHRSVMITLAGAKDEFYRLGIARNPSCPSAILKKLAHDPDERVRAAAAHTLRRCCCDEPSGQPCEAVEATKRTLESAQEYMLSVREDQYQTVTLRDLTGR